MMRYLRALPQLVERILFGGKRTATTQWAAYAVLNLVLILGVFFIILNNVVYDWTGTMYQRGHHLNTALDNLIPFAPGWTIVYLYLFYPFSALTMVYFAFVERRLGYALAWSLVLINLVSDAVYLVFPVTTDIYRAQLLAHPLTNNALAAAMYRHFTVDPSFNCFPSLHAGISVICFYAWYRFARERKKPLVRAAAAFMGFLAVGVMLSTLFVKQHYIVDEITGLLLALGIGFWIYGRHGVLDEPRDPKSGQRRPAEI